MSRSLKRASPLIPYVAVAIGLYCLGSAWVAIVSYHVAMLALVVRGRGLEDRPSEKRAMSGWWYLSSAVFALGGVALYVLWPHAFADSSAVAGRLASLGLGSRVWPYFAVYFCCANSLAEELFWRGYLRQDCRRPVANDFAFAGYHALVLVAFAGPVWAVPVFVGCAFAGWLWRMMRSASGSIAIPVLTHFAADLSIVIAVQLRIRHW